MRSGTKHLRIASVLQIVLGVSSILLTYFLAGEADETTILVSGEEALWALVTAYAGGWFQVLVGLIGLALAKKKSILTVILGVILFTPQLLYFMHLDGNIGLIVFNIILLVIPYYYLHNAWKNFKA